MREKARRPRIVSVRLCPFGISRRTGKKGPNLGPPGRRGTTAPFLATSGRGLRVERLPIFPTSGRFQFGTRTLSNIPARSTDRPRIDVTCTPPSISSAAWTLDAWIRGLELQFPQVPTLAGFILDEEETGESDRMERPADPCASHLHPPPRRPEARNADFRFVASHGSLQLVLTCSGVYASRSRPSAQPRT